MFKTRALATLLFWLALTAVPRAETGLSQRQWVVSLVEALGWSFGLPDNPQDLDYHRLLDGRRQWRIEGEESFQPGDAVSVKTFETFGPYSGSGWLNGLSGRTTATLRFLLPHGGNYRLTAALRRPGHRITLAGRTWEADGPLEFGRVTLGEVELTAGMQDVLIELPPDGSFDYLELSAPERAPVEPLGGWRFEEALDAETLALSVIQLLQLEAVLPPTPESFIIEAEDAVFRQGAEPTEVRLLGEPSGGRWLRAGNLAGEIRLDFSLPSSGIWTLSLRGAGDTPIPARLDERRTLDYPSPGYLQERALGSVLLGEGNHSLQLQLPPRAGIDYLRLDRRASQGEDYRRLVGLSTEGTAPNPTQVDRLLALLAAIGAPR
ncbi:MAG: hypothetical protein RBT64_02085 [Trichloromonas sp.]|nr:hypothetical protein [Trichloromonas sp.]